MYIGKLRHRVNVSLEFEKIEKSDFLASEVLAKGRVYRQACYFVIQAMEKAIRAKIFSLVNPNLEYFRERNRSHSLESAVDFLIEIISEDKVIRTQVSKQLKEYVLGGTKYNRLHNDLRYPSYFINFDSYSVLDVSEEDYLILKDRYKALKVFLNELYMFT